ncbi:hypothetical protein EDB85DRAFT_2139484 [Lactarius pseudohatsudake]|nr:hypothetical protein EDB85DRAFT_2139484 [Lactarius pseudohatsudake]
MDPIYLDGSPASVPYDQIEIDDDDEEDQLASDVDEQPQIIRVPDGEELEPDPDDEDAREGGQTQATTTNGKRKHQRKSGERVPGHTLLPVNRLENILRADGESGPMSKEAQFALSIATEEFIKRFTKAGHQLASAEKRNIISYRDMATIAAQNSSLKFLEDVVPLPIPLSLAFERHALKEKELVDEDPALSAHPVQKPTLLVSAPPHPVSSATTPTTTTATESPGPMSSSAPSRPKSKPRASNGRASGARSKEKSKEHANGTAVPPSDSEHKPRARRSSRRSEPQSSDNPAPTEPPPPSHLHPSDVQPHWEEPLPPRSVHTNPQPWLAGPASGFLDVHVPEGPFGATGRTIYSQR